MLLLNYNMKIKRLMIITGGTGGHIFPGLVIAKYFKNIYCNVKWIGVSNRLESILVPKNNIDIDYVDIPIFNNLNFIKKIFSISLFYKSIYLIIKKIREWKPDLVLGFGGYISFFGILSSWICKVPTMIHEQNSVVGLSNKILYYISDKVVQAFPNTFNNKVKTVGNPIRENILSILPPFKRFINRTNNINILIIGGSQGSNVINNVILDVVKILYRNKYFFFHQTGINYYNKFLNFKNKFNFKNYFCTSFIYDIRKAYIWADLIICRSGALTISEISSIGLASILIPYIHKDNHQYWNAKILLDKNAAIIINENKLNKEYLSKIILNLSREKLLYMSNMAYCRKLKYSNKKFIREMYKI